MNALAELFAAVHAAVAENWPGRVPVRIEIHLHDASTPIMLPIPAPSRNTLRASNPEEIFVPTPFQTAILAALEGKALRTSALATAVHSNESRLFKDKGGLPELREHGLVSHHKALGYFRPDAPPPPLAQDEEPSG